ncbi:UBP-type zinc finger domain-containing protein [Mycolicibacterium sp. S2-37]|uniref:UBP-type zinc finger domain-containing protein n=1 Tax=Mycolicibacterium sp. S2-37 TaxID=2810297 RepID=UPI001A9542DF|nr:UBP-type zinc finger domain-containing protein [Mycolicibacterium sp. S2-37]MBO0681388.1 UBP-type zinc finger domain-containing protein [Mycolicibacterium sp. S2-37]
MRSRARRADRRQPQTAGPRPCEHLASVNTDAVTGTPDGCQGCAELGEVTWAHLRMCMTCGHVGCCDSSPHQHAGEHFRRTGHPVMRSAEPGETWRWCYIDLQLG